MKADRLLSEILLLQAHGRLSAREIAERLEISPRTAQRDMEALCCAGIPLVALRGSEGGWELDPGWRTEVPGMDEAELRAMLMAQPSALGDPHLAAAAERAFGKLMAAMPSSMQAQAVSIRARLHVDSTGWRPFTENLSMLPIVQDAIARDRKLTFTYEPRHGTSDARTVDPLGIVCKQAVWYLVARTAAGMRTYRVSRMSNAVVLPAVFDRPANFDLATYWRDSTAQLQELRQPYSTTIAFSPEAAKAVKAWCRMTDTTPTPRMQYPEGWQVYRVEFEGKSQAKFVVLGLGCQARALLPKELASEVDAEVRRAAAMP